MTIAIVIARLAAFQPQPAENPSKVPCQAAVFREDYQRCKKSYSMVRGTWFLCEPHSRADELEVDFNVYLDRIGVA